MRSCLSCGAPATKASYLGMNWPDGRPQYSLTCIVHLQKLIDHQATLGVEPVVYSLVDVTIVGRCVAGWRSHGCDLPDDHDGNHVCDCGWGPDSNEEVFNIFSDKRCSRTGGVPR